MSNIRNISFGFAIGVVAIFSSSVLAQSSGSDPARQESGQSVSTDDELHREIQELTEQLARLKEAALGRMRSNVPMGGNTTNMGGMNMTAGRSTAGMGMMGMGSMGNGAGGMNMGQGQVSGGMGMDSMMMDGMGMMGMGSMGNGAGGMNMGQGQASGGMGMDSMMMGGMGMMGMAPSQSGTMRMPTPSSALPGFPGASHIYHIGATGFFLDHPDHIKLSQEQQAALNKVKEDSLASQAQFDRQIETAEIELWRTTSSDTPDLDSIAAKSREIGALEAERRIAFIRAVGEAAQILTVEQRTALLGMASPSADMN